MKPASAILLACGLVALAAPRLMAADLDKEQKKLQGTWVSVSYEGAGAKKDSRTVTLTFKGDKLKMKVDDQTHDFEYELDVDSEPKRLDMLVREGGVEVDRNYGIYTLQGDTLKICHGGPVQPTKFEIRTAKFSLDTLIVLKRKR